MIERRYEKADENPVMARRLFLLASAYAAGHVVANKMDTWFPEESPEERLKRQKTEIREHMHRLLENVKPNEAMVIAQKVRQETKKLLEDLQPTDAVNIVWGNADAFQKDHPKRYEAALSISEMVNEDPTLLDFAYEELQRQMQELESDPDCTYSNRLCLMGMSNMVTKDGAKYLLDGVRSHHLAQIEKAKVVQQVKAGVSGIQ